MWGERSGKWGDFEGFYFMFAKVLLHVFMFCYLLLCFLGGDENLGGLECLNLFCCCCGVGPDRFFVGTLYHFGFVM